ncbi:MAG: hypothetical protein LH649_11905 [Pseudanabaena sp. CAN_BIN31]|nr:hypothetical protein [Pseudanabaena sp. CAN_BIN31]
MNVDKNNDKSFDYRQLENDLSYISESIIQAMKDGKCNLRAFSEGENQDSSRFYRIDADLEKSFIEMEIFFNWPEDSYSIMMWDKNIAPTENDKKIWGSRKKDISNCVGTLAWQCSDEESDENCHQFSPEIHSLIYQHVEKLQNFYFSYGSVSSKIKDLV